MGPGKRRGHKGRTMLYTELEPALFLAAAAITVFAGFVKGVVGFAMPILMIGGFGALMPMDLALSCLILPTLVSNAWQASRRGVAGLGQSLRTFRIFLLSGAVMLLISAQLFRVVPDHAMFLFIGVFIGVFAVSELMGLKPRAAETSPGLTQVFFGALAGVMGGTSGIWGPPAIAMLTIRNTPKHEQVRLLGLFFFVGSALLLVAHVLSGVLTPARILLSALMVLPALIGQRLGMAVMDRIDQAMFRRATLVVLLLSGLNLLRRALFA